MGYFICNTWADWFWSSEAGRNGGLATPSRVSLLQSSTFGEAAFRELPFPFCGYPTPAHMLTSDACKRTESDIVKMHVYSTSSAAGSFCRLNESYFVASPEASFLDLASRVDLLELIAIGYEYCGTYAIDPLTSNLISDLQPATNPQRLMRFVEQSPSVRGIQNARIAASLVHAGSASPEETALHMRFTLSGHRGGYGLPASLLNHGIVLNVAARRIYKRGSCRCDLFFPSINLDVEYNGRNHEKRMESDAARDAALKCMKVNTLVVTHRQYRDYLAMSGIVRFIAKAHGIYLSESRAGYTEARAKLMMALDDYRSAANRRKGYAIETL